MVLLVSCPLSLLFPLLRENENLYFKFKFESVLLDPDLWISHEKC